MGCCLSCCDPVGDKENEDEPDLTRPLINPVGPSAGSISGYHSTADREAPKGDEQSALTRILHQTADNVIDVGALETQTMDQLEYMDRARLYSQRLADARSSAQQHRRHTLPAGVAAPQTLLATQPISMADVQLITTAAQQASKAMKDVKVKHKEDLVVPFGVP